MPQQYCDGFGRDKEETADGCEFQRENTNGRNLNFIFLFFEYHEQDQFMNTIKYFPTETSLKRS